MKKFSLVVLVLSVMLLALAGSAGAQEPTPSLELVADATTGCVVTLRINDVADSDLADANGPLQAYDIVVQYPPAITVTPTKINTFFPGTALQIANSCAAGFCHFAYTLFLDPAVNGSGDLHSMTLSGSGSGAMTIQVAPAPNPPFGEMPLLSNPDAGKIGVTVLPGIDVETCGPLAIGEPLDFGGQAGASAALPLLAVAGLMVGASGLFLARRKEG